MMLNLVSLIRFAVLQLGQIRSGTHTYMNTQTYKHIPVSLYNPLHYLITHIVKHVLLLVHVALRDKELVFNVDKVLGSPNQVHISREDAGLCFIEPSTPLSHTPHHLDE